MSKYVIGMDSGGTYTKAALFDLRGNEIALASVKTNGFISQPGFLERDANEIYNQVTSVIRKLFDRAQVSKADIIAVGLTGYGNGLVCLNEDLRPAYNAIMSPDTRAEYIVERWKKDGTAQRIFNEVRHQIWAGQPCALLAWLKENRPDILESSRYYLSIKDYVRFLLTGELYEEITDASSTGVFSLDGSGISEEVFRLAGLESEMHKFPQVRGSAEICGHITEKTAKECGLGQGTPVIGGLTDIQACAYSGGILDENDLSIVIGTWGIQEFLSKKREEIPELFMTAISYIPDYYMIIEASPTCGNNIDWIVGNVLPEGSYDAGTYNTVYSYINAALKNTSAEKQDIIFLPYLYARNGVPNADAAFLGLMGWHTRDHLLRAVYEGTVFSSFYHYERLCTAETARKVKSIRLVGGGSRSAEWMQMYADVFQIPIEILDGSYERGALGAAMLAAVGVGAYRDVREASANMTKVKSRILPDENRAEVYRKKYLRYKKAMKALDYYTNTPDQPV